jgi:hypothetical protein
MSKKELKPDIEPWDRRPWPEVGDDSIEKLYAAAGRALSQWERYESALSLVFSAFVALALTNAARRAYYAVRSFEGRANMLRAASEAYFTENPDPELSMQFNGVLRNAANFSPRRNEIAHGVVNHFMSSRPGSRLATDATYCLYPSNASVRDGELAPLPSYCCSSVELDYFFSEFYQLQEPAASVAMRVVKKAGRATSVVASRSRYLS